MNKNIFKKTKKNVSRGFTLIETLVSLALFTTVLIIAGGTIVSVIDINKKNQAISSVVNNLNYSIDSMIRDIKTGYLYKCDYEGTFTVSALKLDPLKREGECLTDLTLISTITGQDVVVKYKLIPKTGDQNGYIEKTVYKTDGSGDLYNITDKINVNVDSLKFTVINPNALDDISETVLPGQPSVGVVIKGSAGNQSIEVSNFYVQTFISQRLLNLTNFK